MSLCFRFASHLGLAALLVAASVASARPATPPEASKATTPLTEADVRTVMTAQSYTGIDDVKFKEGLWTVDATSADGHHVEVKLNAATGRIIPDRNVSTISRDQVIVKVQDAGYTNVHDLPGGGPGPATSVREALPSRCSGRLYK